MDTNTYSQFRDELKQLATEATQLQGLDERTRSKLNALCERVFKDEFKIVLISPFQGGKSTIFDALCGGEEYSPTGIGLKTSACVCEGHYLSDGNPFAKIEWRSDTELLLGFIDLLLPNLREVDSVRFPQNLDPVSAAAIIDLSKAQDRRLLSEAVERLTGEYQARRSDFSMDDADRLGIAHLTLKHYQTAQEHPARIESDRSPNEISAWIHFPERWGSPSIVGDYPLEKVLFLFIRKVEFWLPVPELKELGAVVVDCPGLNASFYDTMVTTRCIQEATAILCLLGTSGRALAASELEAVRGFSHYGLSKENGVFFGFNAKGVSEQAARHILEAHDIGKLKEVGVSIPGDTVPIFNALLALRCKQIARVNDEESSLSATTCDAVVKKARKQLSPKLLDKHQENSALLRTFLTKDCRDRFNDFTGGDDLVVDGETFGPEHVVRAEKASKWHSTIEQASLYVIERKGRGLLVDRGTAVLSAALAEFEATLEDQERMARLAEDEMAMEKARAKAAVAEFKERADGVLGRFTRALKVPVGCKESDAKQHEVFQDFVDELSTLLGRDKSVEELRCQLCAFIDSAPSERSLQWSFPNAVAQFLTAKVEGWHKRVMSLESKTARDHIQSLILQADAEMRELLERALTDGGGLLKGLDVGAFKVQMTHAFEQAAMRRFDGAQIDKLLNRAEKLPYFGRVVASIRDAYEWLRRKVSGEPFDKHASKLYAKQYAISMLRDDELVRDALRHNVGAVLENYKTSAEDYVNKAVLSARALYEQRLSERNALHKKSESQRRKVGDEAVATRKTIIEPFRQRVGAFEGRVLTEITSAPDETINASQS